MKKASFTLRLLAFLIDMIILIVISSILTQGLISKKTEKLNDKLQNSITEYTSGEITVDDYMTQVQDITYELQKTSFAANLVETLLFIAYFIVFQFLNKGQTLGKKLIKIKVVNEEDDEANIFQMIIRTLFVDQILINLLLVILVKVLTKSTYMQVYYIVTAIYYLFILVTCIMMLYRKDKLSLHDIMSRTKVVKEGK